MKPRVLFIERKQSEFVSIEKVFRHVANALSPAEFEPDFQQVPYANDVVSIIKNLLFFRAAPAPIYHITGQIHYIALLLPPERTVLNIHDLRFLHRRSGLRRFILTRLNLKWPMRRAKHIVTGSEFSKREIVETMGFRSERVHVIANPIDPKLICTRPHAFNSRKPTILQIGTLENKNVPRLVRALDGLSCKLRLIGPMTDEISGALSSVSLEVENAERLTDDEMRVEYENADIVAFCSTYEGFGVPILEAQAMQVPVITSNISPLKDVAGDGAILVDPTDIAAIRSAVEKLVNDDDFRESLVMLGSQNVERFDAKNIAEKYSVIYRQILEPTAADHPSHAGLNSSSQ